MKPLNPDLPIVNKNIDVNVATPNATGPAISVTPPAIPTAPTAPTVTVNVNVTPPSPVNAINVGAVTVATPNVPNVGKIEIDEVTPPVEFEPSIAVMPEAPVAPVAPSEASLPVLTPPIIIPFDITITTTGTGDTCNFWITDGSYASHLGAIQQINVTNGTFDFTRVAGGMGSVSVSGYTGHTTVQNSMTTAYASSTAFTGTYASSWTNGNLTGFYKWCGAPLVRMGANTTWNFTGGGGTRIAILKNDIHNNGDTQTLGKFVNLDTDNVSFSSVKTYATKYQNNTSTGSEIVMTQAEYEYIRDKIYPYLGTTPTSWTPTSGVVRYANMAGTWNLMGSKIDGYEADGHSNYAGANIFHNSGTINVKAAASEIAMTGYGPEAGVATRPVVIANSGTMRIDGTKSTFMVSMRTSANDEVNFINTGNLIINGGLNTGLVLKGSSRATSTINMTTPTEIYGDGNIGVQVSSSTYNINASNSAVKVNIGVNQTGSNSSMPESTVGTGNNAATVTVGAVTYTTGWTTGVIDGNIAILQNATGGTAIGLQSHEIKIGEVTEKNVGVYTNSTREINIGTGKITLYGGKNNVGLYATGSNISDAGTLLVTGTSGNGNVGAYSTSSKTITMSGTATDIIDSTSSNGNLLYVAALDASNNSGTISANSRTLQINGQYNTGIFVEKDSSTGGTVSANKIVINGIGSNVGVFTETGGTVNLTSGIELKGTSDTGIFVKTGVLAGNINGVNVTGGTGNTGIFLANNGSVSNMSTAAVAISGGTGNVGLYSNDYSATVNNLKVEITSKDSGNVGVFAGSTPSTKAEITLTNLDIDMTNNGLNASGNNTAIFAQGIKDASTTNDGIINLTSGTVDMTMDDNGIALFAKDDGVINVNGGTFTLNKSGAAVAVDEGTVNINGGTINYDGNGYVLYFTDYTSPATPVGGNINLGASAVI
ncbi:hypothetical protein M2092_002498, partial [Fusobacterium sp. PH5-44]